MRRAGRAAATLGLGLLLTGSGLAQTGSDESPAGDSQKPEIRTYQDQNLEPPEPAVESYESERGLRTQPGSTRDQPELETYRGALEPQEVQGDALMDRSPLEPRRGDSQKRTLQTYDSEPAPPGTESGPQPAPAPSTMDPDSWPSLETDLEPIRSE